MRFVIEVLLYMTFLLFFTLLAIFWVGGLPSEGASTWQLRGVASAALNSDSFLSAASMGDVMAWLTKTLTEVFSERSDGLVRIGPFRIREIRSRRWGCAAPFNNLNCGGLFSETNQLTDSKVSGFNPQWFPDVALSTLSKLELFYPGSGPPPPPHLNIKK
jgi:hypothetical protein